MSIWASVGDVIEALDGHEEAANYRAEGTPRLEFDVAKTALHDHIQVALWSIGDDGLNNGGLDVCAVLSPTNARNLRDALTIALGEPMSHDDIRQRLAAVEGINWSPRRVEGEEYYGTWDELGPVKMLSTNPDYEPWHAYPSSWPTARRQEYREQAQADRAQEEAVVAFLQHAAADLRRLFIDLDHATTTRESIMPTHSNPVYGPPPEPDRGEPARYLADAIEVQRPNGDVVRMDLVALADAAINADRAVAGLREENAELHRKVATLEEKVERIQRAGRLLAGDLDSREEW